MKTKSSSQYKTELKKKIIRSAVESFAKYGFDRTRMEDIASASGLAKGTLYLYFKSKQDLFYSISEHNLEELRDQLSKLFDRKENILINAERFYDEYQKASIVSDTLWFEMIALSTRNPKLRKILSEYQRKIYGVIGDFLKAQIQKGFLRNDINAENMASGLIALYDGLVLNKFLLQISNSESEKTWAETIKVIVGAATTR
ncbi:MAG TPA: TetR/AcrR family transcriptional regulator [Nitrososphaera sp.]|jgi:AcrR family transcriptional regulator